MPYRAPSYAVLVRKASMKFGCVLSCVALLVIGYAAARHAELRYDRTHHERSFKAPMRPAEDTEPVAFSIWLPKWVSVGSPLELPQQEHSEEQPTALVYYGQDREDEYAYQNFFYGTRRGVYVEIGGMDGKTFSNTLFYHDTLDWRGVLIEANTVNYGKLVTNRPDDINVHSAVCGQSSVVHFVGSAHASAVTGVLEHMSDAFKQKWHKDVDISKLPEIPCIPIGSIFSKLGVQHIDFFSVDVEGAELEVLKSVDFKMVQISVLVVESGGGNPAKDEAVRELLKNNGFQYHGHVIRNDWFVNKNFVPSSMPSSQA